MLQYAVAAPVSAQTPSSCSACGTPLPPDGVCGECLRRDTALIDQGLTHPGSTGVFDLPAQIGPYRILRVLGEGGMGVVYLAEQAEPFRRQVALKVIKIGMDTREVVARFEAERQALALMSHSHIAQIFGAGATEDGRPYFVMEHVAGRADHRLLRSERALDASPTGAVRSRVRRRRARPPEGDHSPRHQAAEHPGDRAGWPPGSEGDRLRRREGHPSAPDREDGLHPLGLAHRHARVHEPGTGGTRRRRDHAARRTSIRWASCSTNCWSARCRSIPPYSVAPATQRFSGSSGKKNRSRRAPDSAASANKAAEVAQRRQTDLSTLARELKGDLDWIALKALEKEPAKRYPSASELAADISRHLQSDRVLARPSSLPFTAPTVRPVASSRRSSRRTF